MLNLLLFVAALIVGFLWCRVYNRSGQIQDSRRLTRPIDAAACRLEGNHGEGRPGAFFHSGRNIRVEGAEFIAARGDYTNITMNFNHHIHPPPQPLSSPPYNHIATEVDRETGGDVNV